MIQIQEEEIRRADIPDLVSCPFCSFATIIPDDDPDKVFRCMNPECLKESCRSACALSASRHIEFVLLLWNSAAVFKQQSPDELL